MRSEWCIRRVNSRYIHSAVLCVLTLCLVSLFAPVVAADNGFPTTHGGISYEGWDLDLVSRMGIGLFPTIEVDWTPAPTAAPLPKVSTSADHWVKLAYYPPGSEPGQPAILGGYVGGRNFNAEVTIAGKMAPSDEFHDIITTRPQENGIFVWAVPDSLNGVVYFQATARVAGVPARSEIVSTSTVSSYIPAESAPASTPTVSTPIVPTRTAAADSPLMTSISLSADSMYPKVGKDVYLSGRVTDSNGKGVSGVTVIIEVPDYGTDFLPLTRASTDGDGRFSAPISTWEPGVVQVRAVFEGNDKFLASTSNALTFTATS